MNKPSEKKPERSRHRRVAEAIVAIQTVLARRKPVSESDARGRSEEVGDPEGQGTAQSEGQTDQIALENPTPESLRQPAEKTITDVGEKVGGARASSRNSSTSK